MTLLDDCVFNNRGADTGLHPHGVPTSYDWYWRGRGTKSWLPSPPGWTSLTGWSTVFPNVGKPNQPADAFIFVRNLKVYVHPKVGRGWTLVQNQGVGGHRVGGSFFEALVDGRNAGAPGGTIQIQPDGSAKLAMPRQGVTFHFWIDPRGVFPANSVNAVYATMEVRADRPNANLITQIGADWWINQEQDTRAAASTIARSRSRTGARSRRTGRLFSSAISRARSS